MRCLDAFGASMIVPDVTFLGLSGHPAGSWGIALIFLFDSSLSSPASPTKLSFPSASLGQMPLPTTEQAQSRS